MPLTPRVTELPEPLLEFGGAAVYVDPKVGLMTEGPFSSRYHGGQPDAVRLGIVGPPEMIYAAKRWFIRCQGTILSRKSNRRRFSDYPGFEPIFRTPLQMADRWQVEIPPVELAKALAAPEHERFQTVLMLFAEGLASLARREMGPNVVLCSIPDSVMEACGTLVRSRETSPRRSSRRTDVDIEVQPRLPFEFQEFSEPETLIYRTFWRALKARVMTMRDRLPIQLANNHLFEDGPGKDDPATRAWSVSVGLFYKAGGLPWRLAHMQPHVCFVGISFHHLRTTQRVSLYASMAQAFSTQVEGFVLRGERIHWRRASRDGPENEPHLTAEQAERLARTVLNQYRERAGRPPVRLTLHKTTQFTSAEREGFLAGFGDVASIELLTLQTSRFRLLTPDEYPPRRGTLCSINDSRHFLYTTGFISDWGTYPGPHVPAPLEITGDSYAGDMRRISEETLGLSKMNWNAASIGGHVPITLHMAGVVGPIMAEVPEDEEPELSYRYYM